MITVRSRSFLSVPALVALAGCASGIDVQDKLDPPSLVRLNAIPDGETIVVSCRFREAPERLSLGDRGTELARTPASVLVEIPKGDLPALGNMEGIQLASVWGDSKSVKKLDPRLRDALLKAWENPSPSRLSLMVRFAPEATGVREKLEAQGVTVRTVAGSIVTIDADPEAVLRLLDIQDLQAVSAPKELKPSGN